MRPLFNARPFTPIPGATFIQITPQMAFLEGGYQPGDFVLEGSTSFLGWIIVLGQKFRFGFWGAKAKYAHWSHTALIVSEMGDLIEANASGIERGHLHNLVGTEYILVRTGELLSAEDRRQAVAFAEAALGQPYGYVTFLSIAFSCLTGLKFSFGFDGQEVCSGLVARALERGRCIFSRDPRHIAPGDLALYFGITP